MEQANIDKDRELSVRVMESPLEMMPRVEDVVNNMKELPRQQAYLDKLKALDIDANSSQEWKDLIEKIMADNKEIARRYTKELERMENLLDRHGVTKIAIS